MNTKNVHMIGLDTLQSLILTPEDLKERLEEILGCEIPMFFDRQELAGQECACYQLPEVCKWGECDFTYANPHHAFSSILLSMV
jgi:hypothetical protein